MSNNSIIRTAGIVSESIVDGPGIRYVVFAQGCNHNCPGCHNKHTHDFNGGTLTTVKNIIDDMKRNPLLDGITLSGGEPFEQAEAFSVLAKEVKTMGLNVMTYTGYTFEKIMEEKIVHKGWGALLRATDILVDGKFEEKRKNPMLPFRGSDNQRIIDINESISRESIVEAKIG